MRSKWLPVPKNSSFVNFVDKIYYFCSFANGIIMFIKEVCIALIFDSKENIFLFDPHRKNSEGSIYCIAISDGKSILIKFLSMLDLET